MPTPNIQSLLFDAFTVNRVYYSVSSGSLAISVAGRSGTPTQLPLTEGSKDVRWIVVPLPSFSPLTAAEVAADGRKAALLLARVLREGYLSLPTAQRPTAINIERSSPIALTETTVRQTFTLTVDLNIGPADVALE